MKAKTFFVLLTGLILSKTAFAAKKTDRPTDTLLGTWQGTAQQHLVYQTTYHQVIYDAGLQLTLHIDELMIAGQGTAHVSNPIITDIADTSVLHMHPQWQATYLPTDFPVSVKGYRAGDGSLSLTIKPSTNVKVKINYQDRLSEKETNTVDFIGAIFPDSIPTTKQGIGHFSWHEHLKDGEGMRQTVDIIYAKQEELLTMDYDCSGVFIQTGSKLWVALLAALLGFFGIAGALYKLLPGSTGSGMMWALAGALFSGIEKFKEWGIIQPSFSPGTGRPIAGTALRYPLRNIGVAAQGLGVGLALVTQFKESSEIWSGNGSTLNRTIREGVSLSVNIGVASASAALIAVTAETGPGLALGIMGASLVGASGEFLKSGIQTLINQKIP
jgi:hypothetical protein